MTALVESRAPAARLLACAALDALGVAPLAGAALVGTHVARDGAGGVDGADVDDDDDDEAEAGARGRATTAGGGGDGLGEDASLSEGDNAAGGLPATGALPFEIDAHPAARSHVARAMLARLREDVSHHVAARPPPAPSTTAACRGGGAELQRQPPRIVWIPTSHAARRALFLPAMEGALPPNPR